MIPEPNIVTPEEWKAVAIGDTVAEDAVLEHNRWSSFILTGTKVVGGH